MDAKELVYDLEEMFERTVQDKVYEIAYNDGLEEGQKEVIGIIKNSDLDNKEEIVKLINEKL